MSTTLYQQQADNAPRTSAREPDGSQLGLLVRAAAALLQRAHAQLHEALNSAESRRAEVIEQVAFEIETSVLTALSLSHHADVLQAEQRTSRSVRSNMSSMCADGDKSSASEETIRRLIGNARQIENELNQAVRSLPPTRRQLAAVDQLLKQVRAPGGPS